MHFCCRAPYGARGLKYIRYPRKFFFLLSRPVWGAWIEIGACWAMNNAALVAPRMGRVD